MSQTDKSKQTLHSMRVASRMTGLTPDTIRAWEKRYQAINPQRTTGGTRRYSAQDIRRLILLREATQHGHSIGGIANLENAALENLLSATRQQNSAATLQSPNALCTQYLDAISTFNIRRAQSLLSRSCALLSTRDFVFEMVIPILQEVGNRWSHQDLGIAQEHLVSSQIRSLLSSLLQLSSPDQGFNKVLITTPPGHTHEFGVLIGAILAASRKMDTIYLGPNLPVDEIMWSLEMSQAPILLLGISTDFSPSDTDAFRSFVQQIPAQVSIWVGAPEDHALAHIPERIRLFHSFQDLDIAFAELSR